MGERPPGPSSRGATFFLVAFMVTTLLSAAWVSEFFRQAFHQNGMFLHHEDDYCPDWNWNKDE